MEISKDTLWQNKILYRTCTLQINLTIREGPERFVLDCI